MAAGSLKLAFVMDPLESEDFGASTTVILMVEAQRRGHEVEVAHDATQALELVLPALKHEKLVRGQSESLGCRK